MTASTSLAPAAVTAPTVHPALILLGRDDAGRAHASWFDQKEAPKAADAAAVMGMTALTITTDEHRDLAGKLPRGRLFSSGKAFVPFVAGPLFKRLAAHAPDADKIVPKKPNGSAAASASDAAGKTGVSKQSAELTLPDDWSKIANGSLVLASEGASEGWFEAVVMGVSDNDLLTLKWRDWSDEPSFVRNRINVALLHPDHEAS